MQALIKDDSRLKNLITNIIKIELLNYCYKCSLISDGAKLLFEKK